MKLNELHEFLEESAKNKNSKSGAFVGAAFSEKTQKELTELSKACGIEDPIDKADLHVTIMFTYSDLPDLVSEIDKNFDPPKIAKAEKFEIFEGEDEKCLVLRISCPYLNERHESIINDYGAVYTYDEYKPHVTLSYNFDKEKVEKLNIKKYIDKLEIVREYSGVLD